VYIYINQGFCIDLAAELQKASSRHFDYYIDLVGDKNYGSRKEDYGCWDGMIGELISSRGCPNGTRKVRTKIQLIYLMPYGKEEVNRGIHV
jgi:hypothetical protein